MKKNYNTKSFWYYPWRKSVVHHGFDIFAKEGKLVFSATQGIILFKGKLSLGGNVVLVFGLKWLLYYYPHLEQYNTDFSLFVGNNTQINSVGTTGNAAEKTAHLYYAIVSRIPYP